MISLPEIPDVPQPAFALRFIAKTYPIIVWLGFSITFCLVQLNQSKGETTWKHNSPLFQKISKRFEVKPVLMASGKVVPYALESQKR